MNRDIKFRAWDKTQNKIITDFLMENVKGFDRSRMAISFNGEIFAFTDWDLADYEESEMFNTACYVERFEVMQYTGLKDKNNKEIYEGDIIKRGDVVLNDIFEIKIDEIKVSIPQLGNSVTIKALILYDRETDYKQVMDIKQQLISIETNTEYEVIGNIYEDLELLSR